MRSFVKITMLLSIASTSMLSCRMFSPSTPRRFHVQTQKFPGKIRYKYITPLNRKSARDVALEMYRDPSGLKLEAPRAVRFHGNKLYIDMYLVNYDFKKFLLTVTPYGGPPHPSGGSSPFRIDLAETSRKKVIFSGKLYPVTEPLPMLIEIPGKTRVQFTEEINLDHYEYRGTPEIEIEWHFYFLKGTPPHGKIKVTLPEK